MIRRLLTFLVSTGLWAIFWTTLSVCMGTHIDLPWLGAFFVACGAAYLFWAASEPIPRALCAACVVCGLENLIAATCLFARVGP